MACAGGEVAEPRPVERLPGGDHPVGIAAQPAAPFLPILGRDVLDADDFVIAVGGHPAQRIDAFLDHALRGAGRNDDRDQPGFCQNPLQAIGTGNRTVADFTGDAAPIERPLECLFRLFPGVFQVIDAGLRALAQHRRNVPDCLGRLGAAQHQIVFAMAQQYLARVCDHSDQIGARAPQPPDIIGGQHQVGRPLRLEKSLDGAGGRIAATLVAVEKIGGAVHRRGNRHFEKRVDAEFVARREHGENTSPAAAPAADAMPARARGVRLRHISARPFNPSLPASSRSRTGADFLPAPCGTISSRQFG